MPWQVQHEGEVVVVEGEVGAAEAPALAAALATLPGPVLDLLDLELLDGVAVAEAVNGLRALQSRWGRLELHHAPQMLAHTLYKVGDLGDPALVLIAPRHDEGFGAG